MAAPMVKKFFTLHKLTRNLRTAAPNRQFSDSKLSVKDILSTTLQSEKLPVSAKGWLKHARKQKQLVFMSLVDGSCPGHVQVVADANICQSDITPGSSVHVKGDLIKSPGKGQAVEIQASQIEVLGPCNNEVCPVLPKVTYSLDHLRTLPHMRARSQHHQRLLEIRNAASMAVHGFFQAGGYIFIHTPILTSNDCEGAGEMFQVKTGKDVQKDSDSSVSSKGEEKSSHFFNHPAFLTVSGQLHLEAITGAFGKAYNFSPAFRAENSPGRHHLAEFYMIEAEIAFTQSIECILKVMESLVHEVTRYIMEDHEESVNYMWSQSSSSQLETKARKLAEANFIRMTYSEAIHILEKKKFKIAAKWGNDLAKEHEKYLVQYCDNTPVFVTDFPAAIKPFYARQNEAGDTVSCVDLLVPEVGELCGGSLREERYDVLQPRLESLGLAEQYQWYLDLRRFGSVPHGGFGLGFERYLQCLLGISNIKDTIPFPRWVNHCQL